MTPGAERTAEVLVERHGHSAFEFAARHVALLHLAGQEASADEWRSIAYEIERIIGNTRDQSAAESGALRSPRRPLSSRGAQEALDRALEQGI